MELVELKTVRSILKPDIAFTVILITGFQRITNIQEGMSKKDVLERRLARLKDSLSKERERLNRVSSNIPWGAGMRRTKCTPSFRKEDELKEKIQNVKIQLSELEKNKKEVKYEK